MRASHLHDKVVRDIWLFSNIFPNHTPYTAFEDGYTRFSQVCIHLDPTARQRSDMARCVNQVSAELSELTNYSYAIDYVHSMGS